MTTIAIATLAGLVLVGCASVPHIGEYRPRERDYRSPVSFEESSDAKANGSLFGGDEPGTYLFADQRAMRLGDIVTVRVSERADAKRGASTELQRDSEVNVAITRLFGLLEAAGVDGAMVGAGTGSDFSGAGTTSRSERLEATVPAIVRRVLPNGSLFVEGHRVILVNLEEHHFYISGVVRPVDIDGDNSIPSYLIADAEIEFSGRGVVSERQRPGWGQRALDYITPF